MHTTIVKLKSGEQYEGMINLFRPAFGWFTLFGYERKFYFDDCESVVTHDQRVSIYSSVDGEYSDEMLRAKDDLDWGREHGWTEDGNPYPKEKFEWEKKYEKGS